jgi:hypothetical protein
MEEASFLWGSGLQLGVREDILGEGGGRRKSLTSGKTKHRNRLNLEPALILALNEDPSQS